MISCNDYDYIEIVCLYRYPVRLSLKYGVILEGVAIDTKRNDTRAECIELIIEGERQLVVLEDITKLTVTKENPHFTEVVFN